MSKGNLGKKFTPEHRARIANALRGRQRSPEHCRAISRAKTGLRLSPEHRASIRRAALEPDALEHNRLSNTAENNPNWRGGVRINAEGYRMVRVGRRRYILEHRLVMAAALGRDLLPTEAVHHKNGDKLDNRIENLELMSFSEHRRLHCKNGRCVI